MKAVFAIALLSVSLFTWWQEAPREPRFSNLSNEIAAHADVPGLAVAVTKDGKIIYERGTAIMQLFERGRLNLDAPVNDYLGPAKLKSPQWNPAEATVRRVMSHTGALTTFTRWCGSDHSTCNLDREIRDYGILVWHPGGSSIIRISALASSARSSSESRGTITTTM